MRKLNCEHETPNKKAHPQCADLPSTHSSTLEDTNPSHSVPDVSESTGGDAEEILTSENVVDDHTTTMLALPTKEAGYVCHLYIFTAHSVHSSF